MSCPIYAFYAGDDEVATYAKVAPWSDGTTADFAVREFAGHHFYLNDDLPELVKDIEARIVARCALD